MDDGRAATLALSAEGDAHSGFAALVRRTTPALHRFLVRRTGSAPDAEDLAQEALLRLWRARQRHAIDNEDAFLQTIASNLLRDRGRRDRSAGPPALPLDAAHAVRAPCADPHRTAAARQTLARYQAAVDRLRPKTRAIFLLHRLDDLTYAQIAERLGLSVSAVEKHMMKAILHLDRAIAR